MCCPSLIAMQTAQTEQEKIVSGAPSIDIAQQLGIRTLIIVFDPANLDRYIPGNCDWGPSRATIYQAMTSNSVVITNNLLLQYIKSCHPSLLDRWYIYKTKPFAVPKSKETYHRTAGSLVVLIPKNSTNDVYINKLQSFQAGGKDKNISDGELLLGIKINNLDEKEQSQDNSYDYLDKYLSKILVTHQDVKGWKEDYLNRWDIYLNGHGAFYVIAGMPRSSFQAMLDFLNLGINTRSLFYLSCSTGGEQNLINVYQHRNKTPKQEREAGPHQEVGDIQYKDFNYMIISANTFRTFTWVTYSKLSFDRYFETLNAYFANPKTTNITKIFEFAGISPEDSFIEDNKNNILQLPTIRFPHTGWFKVANIGEGAQLYKLYALDDSKIMQAINANKTEIVIPNDVKMIVFKPAYIPIPIKINSSTFPLLVPEFSYTYVFQEIRAPNAVLVEKNSTTDLVSMLKNLLKRTYWVSDFYIKKLTIRVENKTQAPSSLPNLNWPDKEITFDNVRIGISSGAVTNINAVYNGKLFNFSVADDAWHLEDNDKLTKYLRQYSSEVRYTTTESKLPKSMLGENPKPMIEIKPPKESDSRPEIIGNVPQEPE
jgi:hypothetical protein